VLSVCVAGGDALVVFDRPVLSSGGLSVLLTIGAVTVTYPVIIAAVGAIVAVISGPIVAGDPWQCLRGVDPVLSVPPGGGGNLDGVAGVVFDFI